ncbi:hypothetical protein niasHT_032012 [Heterodera trifolii]|uniref:Secreted protein n=1 Tax=Heterodera trifolii TaxID=157864 RepID=A0ABD2I5T4_9BILA
MLQPIVAMSAFSPVCCDPCSKEYWGCKAKCETATRRTWRESRTALLRWTNVRKRTATTNYAHARWANIGKSMANGPRKENCGKND